MRQNDYERYRQYCTVKLHRTRKRIGFLNKRGKLYHKMEFTASNVKDANSLFYPLLNAERAWAYANELKEKLSDTREMRIRFHVVGRIRRASRWSEQLMNLCHELADDRTKLESDAYFSFMKGSEGMECGDWVLSLV